LVKQEADGKTHNQIDHILVDRRRHSNILDVRSFRAADCDSDHYLVVAKVRERLAVNKQRSQRFDMERFNLKKLNHVEGKEQFRVEVSTRFAALEDLDTEVEINSSSNTVLFKKNVINMGISLYNKILNQVKLKENFNSFIKDL
jgi:hypothetical protein